MCNNLLKKKITDLKLKENAILKIKFLRHDYLNCLKQYFVNKIGMHGITEVSMSTSGGFFYFLCDAAISMELFNL